MLMAKVQYPQEEIDDVSIMYCRIHKNNVIDSGGSRKILPVAFDPTPYDNPDGLSVNWDKYSDAQTTRDEVSSRGKMPSNYGVVSLVTSELRKVPLEVIHRPTINRAHSLIVGIPPRVANDARKALMLINMCKWEINI